MQSRDAIGRRRQVSLRVQVPTSLIAVLLIVGSSIGSVAAGGDYANDVAGVLNTQASTAPLFEACPLDAP